MFRQKAVVSVYSAQTANVSNVQTLAVSEQRSLLIRSYQPAHYLHDAVPSSTLFLFASLVLEARDIEKREFHFHLLNVEKSPFSHIPHRWESHNAL